MAWLALTVATARAGAAAPPSAQALVDTALAKAKPSHKTVLVDFGASWCGYCKRFDAFLQSDGVAPLIDAHFEVVHLVVDEKDEALENPGGAALKESLGGGRAGLPFYAFLDGDGRKVGDSLMPDGNNMGHPMSAAEIQRFGEVLRTAAPRLAEDERRRMTDTLSALESKRRWQARLRAPLVWLRVPGHTRLAVCAAALLGLAIWVGLRMRPR